ncbi:hypothetical protein ACNFIA_01340 [Pseudomonas sp. NY15437]|uniref:hypothetical protein n=1 Tax=Pseudomonas sp. NY15437 TaxID=3400360 RepID=UPI003A8615B5
MNTQAFDERNKKDFDKNTEMLTEGLLRIASEKSLKATVAELSRITGIHRNTIRQRKWPLERLDAIKDNRELDALAEKIKVEKKKDAKSILSDRLEKSRLEVLYWFDKYQESESNFFTLEKRLNLIRESRDFYVKMYEEKCEKVKSQEAEIAKLHEALKLISSGFEESK